MPMAQRFIVMAAATGGRAMSLPAIYFISFFPHAVIATVSIRTKIRIAHGKNGNRLKAVLTPPELKSCKEQEIR